MSAMEANMDEMKLQMGTIGSVLERLTRRMEEDDLRRREKRKGAETGQSSEGGVDSISTPVTQTTPPTSPSRIVTPGRTSEPLSRCLEIPTFNGENADSWTMRVEQYFELEEFTEEEKMQAVKMSYEGDALLWYRWEREENPFFSWEMMKVRVLEHFASEEESSPAERLFALRQTSSAVQYCRDFIAIAANAPELTEKVREIAFMTGLDPNTKAGLKLFEVRGLKKMMSVAKKVEE